MQSLRAQLDAQRQLLAAVEAEARGAARDAARQRARNEGAAGVVERLRGQGGLLEGRVEEVARREEHLRVRESVWEGLCDGGRGAGGGGMRLWDTGASSG